MNLYVLLVLAGCICLSIALAFVILQIGALEHQLLNTRQAPATNGNFRRASNP